MAIFLAHRGASALAPENTLIAYRKAQQLGADGVEFDVQQCATGELVVFHDRFPLRTTDYAQVYPKKKGKRRARSISNLTWNELKSLDAGAWKDSVFAGERVPRLSDFLAQAKSGEFLDIEIKTYRFRHAALIEGILQELERSRPKGVEIVISSFNPSFLRQFRQRTTSFPIGLISEAHPPPNRSRRVWQKVLKPEYLFVQMHKGLRADVKMAAKAKRSVMVWTVDDPAKMQLAIDAGANGIISNRPELIAELPATLRTSFGRT